MKPPPRVSIVTPMYNAGRYIESAVQSMLDQTFTDFEFIIVDDGSTDDSAAIVARYAVADARIRLVRMEVNSGYSRAMNRAFGLAAGDYIACMDADDMSLPQRLEKQVAYLDAHPDTGLVATQYYKMDENGRVVRKTRNRLDDLLLRFHLMFGVPVCNPTTMFRKSIVNDFGANVYDPANVAAPEYDFMLRLAQEWKMHVLPDYLFRYRVNSQGLSKLKKKVLVAETLPLALAYLETYGMLTEAERTLVARFIPLQLNPQEPLSAENLKDYVKGMALLERHYSRKLDLKERLRVKLFALEVEAKTLLGRHKMVKQPKLVAKWLCLRLTEWARSLRA